MRKFKKMIQINLFTKQRLTNLENRFMVTKGERWGGGINWEFGTDIYMLLYLK